MLINAGNMFHHEDLVSSLNLQSGSQLQCVISTVWITVQVGKREN